MTGQRSATAPAPGDPEYRTWLRHTQKCTECRAKGNPCPTALQLGRRWKAAR